MTSLDGGQHADFALTYGSQAVSMQDEIVVAMFVLSFALWVTSHLAIMVGLLARPPRLRAPVALVVAPLAPYWAVRERMLARAIAWVVGGVAYGMAWLLASG